MSPIEYTHAKPHIAKVETPQSKTLEGLRLFGEGYEEGGTKATDIVRKYLPQGMYTEGVLNQLDGKLEKKAYLTKDDKRKGSDTAIAGGASALMGAPIVGTSIAAAALAPEGRKLRAAGHTAVGGTLGAVAGGVTGGLLGHVAGKTPLSRAVGFGLGALGGNMYGSKKGYEHAVSRGLPERARAHLSEHLPVD